MTKISHWQQRARAATVPELPACPSPPHLLFTHKHRADPKPLESSYLSVALPNLGRKEKSFKGWWSLHPCLCSVCVWGGSPGQSSDMALAPALWHPLEGESALAGYNYPSLPQPQPAAHTCSVTPGMLWDWLAPELVCVGLCYSQYPGNFPLC